MFFCSFLTPCVDPAHSMNLLIVFEVMFFFQPLILKFRFLDGSP